MNKIKRILFVDDDVIIGLVTKRLLEQMQVAEEIIVHSDSVEALGIIKKLFHPGLCSQGDKAGITLIFLDIEMPGYGGFELLSLIKDLCMSGEMHLQNTYFVIVTSHKGEKEILKAKAYDVLDVIEKPLRLAHIQFLLDKIAN